MLHLMGLPLPGEALGLAVFVRVPDIPNLSILSFLPFLFTFLKHQV